MKGGAVWTPDAPWSVWFARVFVRRPKPRSRVLDADKLDMPEMVEDLHHHLPDLSEEDIDRVLKTYWSRIANHLDHGRQVRVHGFGKFFTRRRPAGKRRLPDGAVVAYPVRDKPQFRFSPTLQAALARPGPENGD